MNASSSSKPARAARTKILLTALAALIVAAGGLLWWQSRPVVLPALATPAQPSSPYALENPGPPPPGGMRFRSEPLLTPFQFRPDPFRRKISAFELVVRPRSTGAISGTLYFDTREITFNEFGDELIATNQTAEAHRVRLEEVPRAQIEAVNQRSGFGDRHKLSATKRLFHVVFEQGEHPGQFRFVYDAGNQRNHSLWILSRAPDQPGAPVAGGDYGLAMLGDQPAPDGPIVAPFGLSGYRSAGDGRMQLMSVNAARDGMATVKLDRNSHNLDALADPTGLTTLMAFPDLKCSLTLLDSKDPTGQGRQLWRLKQLPNAPGNQTRWGPPSAEDYFDLVIAPSSNGRHRLLIYKTNQLQDIAQLHDSHARRRAQLVSEAQPAKDAERRAVLALQQEDKSAQFTLEGDRVISLFVTREAPPASVARVLRALPSLEKVTLFWGPLTTNIAAALSTLRHLKHLDCNSSTIDDGAFAHLGKLRQLEVLEIHHPNRITDRAMPHIAKLTNLTTLAINTEFHPRPNNWRELVLSEKGIAHVTALKRLTHLNLHGQNASDANCAQLAKLPRLTNLALSGEQLTDAGLAALKPMANLADLHLWDTGITRTAAEAFKRPGLQFEPGPFGRDHE